MQDEMDDDETSGVSSPAPTDNDSEVEPEKAPCVKSKKSVPLVDAMKPERMAKLINAAPIPGKQVVARLMFDECFWVGHVKKYQVCGLKVAAV